MKKTTTATLKRKKKEGRKITALTCYNYSMARIMAMMDIDIILVGDSVGMVELGYENTIPVTVEDIIHHTRAVKRAGGSALVVSDMPFMSFNLSKEETLENAGRIIKEGRAEAVKLEGGKVSASVTKHLVDNGIPVMGHIGLTPQSVNQIGGYKVQGKDKEAVNKLLADAKALEEAGVFAIVLEAMPSDVAGLITSKLSVATIGIGAGRNCDGQILVVNDLLGMDLSFKPKFVKRYARLEETIKKALKSYSTDVKKGKFPSEEESY